MEDIQRIQANPKFRALVSKRNVYAFIMTMLVMVVYYGFILLVAFNKEFLAQKLGAGVTSIGIPIGVGVIVFTIVITAIFVHRANTEFDAEFEEIVKGGQK